MDKQCTCGKVNSISLEHSVTCPIHIGFYGFEDDGRAPRICVCGVLHTYEEYEEAVKKGIDKA